MYYNERKTYQIPLCVDNILFNHIDKQNVKDKYGFSDIEKFGWVKKVGIFVGALNETKGWNRIQNIINIHKNLLWIIMSKDDNKCNMDNVVMFNRINQKQICELLNCADFFYNWF